jgi:hypothetical protein
LGEVIFVTRKFGNQIKAMPKNFQAIVPERASQARLGCESNLKSVEHKFNLDFRFDAF